MVHRISGVNWNEQARRALLHVEAELTEAHRGALPWHISGPTVVLFDGRTSDDEFTERQLEFIRLLIETYGGSERSLLWNDSKTTWVMIATGVSDEYGHEFVCASLEYARGALTVDGYHQGHWRMNRYDWLEQDVAQQTIEAHYSNPNRWKNCQAS
jgi:hypothetical protein